MAFVSTPMEGLAREATVVPASGGEAQILPLRVSHQKDKPPEMDGLSRSRQQEVQVPAGDKCSYFFLVTNVGMVMCEVVAPVI